MLEVNLLPVREARRKADIRQQLMQLFLALLVMGGGVGVVHSRISDDIEMAQTRVRQMENDIKQFEPQLNQVAAFKKKKSQLEKKIDVIEGLDRARSGPVRMLAELASRTPERLWLTQLTTKGAMVTIKGKSLDNELVAQFLGELVDSKYFDGVDLDSTALGEGKAGGLKLITFGIHAKMSDPDAPKEKSADKKGGKKADKRASKGKGKDKNQNNADADA
jgi:type IV pilus assembly protein PilN